MLEREMKQVVEYAQMGLTYANEEFESKLRSEEEKN